MPRCSACEVGWGSAAELCWNCGGQGDGVGTYSSPGQTQETLPAALIELNRGWMATADVAGLLADT